MRIWSDGKQHRKTTDGWVEVAEHEIHYGSFSGEIDPNYSKRQLSEVKQKLFGEKQPTNIELAQMAGAHKDENIQITPFKNHIQVLVTHDDYTAMTFIRKGAIQFIENFEVTKNNDELKGLGFKILQSQILTGSKFGISYLSAIAKRDDLNGLNGYYTWAVYGYDGEIPKSIGFPSQLKTVQQVLSLKGGREIWMQKGDTFKGKFSLTKNSWNIKDFYRYAKGKGYAR